jgi:hypothetical protein
LLDPHAEEPEQQLKHKIGADPGEDIVQYDAPTPFDLAICG